MMWRAELSGFMGLQSAPKCDSFLSESTATNTGEVLVRMRQFATLLGHPRSSASGTVEANTKMRSQ